MPGRFEMAPCAICREEFVFIDKQVRCTVVGDDEVPVCPNCIQFVRADLLIEAGRGPSVRRSVLVFVFDRYVEEDYDATDDVADCYVEDDGLEDDGGLIDPEGFFYGCVYEDEE
jgi:hypothetical protein